MIQSSLLPSSPIETFMEYFHLSFPDVQGCAALYYSKVDNGLRLAWLDYESEHTSFQSRIFNVLLINKKIRENVSAKQISWNKFSPLPAEIRKVLRKQPEVFDSGKEDILIFRHLNNYDNKMDLIYFDLGKWKSKAKKRGSMVDISNQSSQKVFADTLNAFFLSVIKKSEEDRLKWEIILSNSQSLVLENQKLKQQIESFEKEKRDSQILYARDYLNKISKEQGFRLMLRPDAEEKIKRFDGHEIQLKRALLGAITFAREINWSKNEDVYYIGEQHIHFSDSENYFIEVDPDATKSSKYSKTVQLLNRFEKAALIVKTRNEKLTSANLGKYCEPNTISPPGIRDAIRNHEGNILFLLEKRKSEWNIIRNEFKPILNLINSKK